MKQSVVEQSVVKQLVVEQSVVKQKVVEAAAVGGGGCSRRRWRL